MHSKESNIFQRKCCVSLLRVLQQVPQCTEETLQSFDSRIISMITNNELVVEKVRREIVKKLLRPLIAVCQFFFTGTNLLKIFELCCNMIDENKHFLERYWGIMVYTISRVGLPKM